MDTDKYNKPRPTIPAEISRLIKVEAGHACVINHCAEHTYLEIHHINGNREDNRLENLILLCDKHHKMAHKNVIDKKALRVYKKLLDIPNLTDIEARFEKLESMILQTTETNTSSSLSLILEEAALLGRKLHGTREGNDLAQQIFSLLRKHGGELNIDTIDLMVLRDGSYSRTGLSGLEILYDDYFEHMKSLNLIKHYYAIDVPEIEYYCALREEYPSEKNMSICIKAINFTYGGLKVFCDEGDILSKYPNRGPSAIIDYLNYESTK